MKKITVSASRKYDVIVAVSYTHLDVYKRQVLIMEEKKFDITKVSPDTGEKHYILTGEEKEKSRYGKLVFEFPQEHNEVVADGDPADFVVDPQAYFRGASQIPGSEFNSSFQIFVKPFFLDRVQHRHPKDEYLVFLGASFPNVFDFDAKIEFTLGKGDEAETFVITKPTIILSLIHILQTPLPDSDRSRFSRP